MTSAGLIAALLTGLGFYRLTIPFRIAEVVMCLHEIIDGEMVFAVVETRTAPDDLLELDHRIDWTHQNNIADVSRINPGR